MFILHSSNLTENLLQHLATVIRSKPLDSVFDAEIFLIQSQGMERWLSQQLASELGVWGHYEFLFPAKFFNRLAQQAGGSLLAENFDRFELIWQFEGLLRQLEGDAIPSDLQPLAHYLTHQASSTKSAELKRFYLARQLAMLFDQYQMMRPDLLAAWQSGERVTESSDELWQMRLWQQLTAQLGTEHRGAQWQQTIERLASDKAFPRLPQRVHLFGLNTLPPLFLQFIQALSTQIEVHFYLLGPTGSYWGDVHSPKQQARERAEQQLALSFDEQADLPVNNPFLSALGQQGREFHNLLLSTDADHLEVDSFAAFAHDEVQTALQSVQASIYANEAVKSLVQDQSVQFHACHSPLREVQVLKDQLLACLERNPELAWRDMVVMAPDIQTYAPFIETVFEGIPHDIADKTLKAESPAVDAFALFLDVIQGRFGWESVLDLLAMAPVLQAFDLSEEELEWIEKWVAETEIRWGKSAAHWQALDLPEMAANTWQMGLDRMLMGFMLGDESLTEGGEMPLLPYGEIEGSSAQILGKLVVFMQFLFAASESVQTVQSRLAWQALFRQLAERLLPEDVALNQPLTQLFDALVNADLQSMTEQLQGQNEALYPLSVIEAWLHTQVDERKSSNGFLRGQLTFCSMLPMRSIPFKVIALMGMNEGAFPRVERPLSFDLIAQHFRVGDRSRRADERYQFLEVLLSARETLLITWQGQSMQNNDPLPPAVVVSELLDQLGEPQDWVAYHPLHPFSGRYFDAANTAWQSYDAEAYQAAQAFYQARQVQADLPQTQAWWQGQLPEGTTHELKEVALDELMQFIRSPQVWFVKNRLDLVLAQTEAARAENEPFAVNGLDHYILMNDWLAALKQAGAATSELYEAQLLNSGKWPAGAQGQILLQEKRGELASYFTTWQDLKLGAALEKPYFDFIEAGWRVQGQLPQVSYLQSRHPAFGRGNVWVAERYANRKAKDVLSAWLVHCVHSAATGLQQPTLLLMKNGQWGFNPLEKHQAWCFLEAFLDLFEQGQLAPSELIIEAAWAWMEQTFNLENKTTRSKKTPLQVARETFEGLYDLEITLLYGDLTAEDVITEAHEGLFETLMRPIIEQMQPLEAFLEGTE